MPGLDWKVRDISVAPGSIGLQTLSYPVSPPSPSFLPQFQLFHLIQLIVLLPKTPAAVSRFIFPRSLPSPCESFHTACLFGCVEIVHLMDFFENLFHSIERWASLSSAHLDSACVVMLICCFSKKIKIDWKLKKKDIRFKSKVNPCYFTDLTQELMIATARFINKSIVSGSSLCVCEPLRSMLTKFEVHNDVYLPVLATPHLQEGTQTAQLKLCTPDQHLPTSTIDPWKWLFQSFCFFRFHL